MDKLTAFVKTAASMLIIISLVRQIMPGKKYEKFLNSYLGMLFILLILSPIAKEDILPVLTAADFDSFIINDTYALKNKAAIISEDLSLNQLKRVVDGQVMDLFSTYGISVISVDSKLGYDNEHIEISEIDIVCRDSPNEGELLSVSEELENIFGAASVSFNINGDQYGIYKEE